MSLEEISLLIGLIATGVSLLGTIVGFITKVVKDIKDKKLKKLVEELMIEAEKRQMSGEEKKRYVIQGVKEYLKPYGKEVEKLTIKASDYIEECIDFSKKINHK